MLKLSNIVKNYPAGSTTVHALRGISVEFRESEFVAILGPSGCGKTTMLNIIGGLDRYTSGDLVIGGVSTKDFDEQHWDAYRNATIGFVFQSYNLIPHLTVVENVEMALSLVGIRHKERRAKAIAALNRVGMADEINKRPNQLSGGQMQRVAIARAIVNDPKIILADEPTGALDSELSVQVMDILAEIAKTRLVVMVTHNPELAKEYCTRIVRFKDGTIIEDTDPYESAEESEVAQEENEDFDILTADAHQELSFASQVEVKEKKEEINVFPEGFEGAAAIETENVSMSTAGAGDGQSIISDSLSEDDKNTKGTKSPLDEYKPMQLGELEPKKKKKTSNRKRKKTMKELNAETKAYFDQLGLNSLSKKKKKERPAGFKPTHMRASTAFGLSLKNLFSKFRRTFFTSFAGSIGIIGLALVLSVSNGFNLYVKRMQTEQFASVPLGMYEYNVDSNAVLNMMTNLSSTQISESAYPTDGSLKIKDSVSTLELLNVMINSFFDGNASKNDITPEFDEYVHEMPTEYYKAISTYYGTRFNLVSKYLDKDGNTKYEDVSQMPDATSVLTISTTVLGQQGQQPELWNQMVGTEEEMTSHYDVLAGHYPENKFEVVVCVNADNEISKTLINGFRLYNVYERDADNRFVIENGYAKIKENLSLDDLIGQEIHLVLNDDYYQKDADGNYVVDEWNGYSNSIATFMGGGGGKPWYYTDSELLADMYETKSIPLTISGVIRLKKGDTAEYVSRDTICYTEELGIYVANEAYKSKVAKYQREIEESLGGGKSNDKFATKDVFGNSIAADVNLLDHHEVMDIMGGAMHTHSSYLKAIGAVKIPLYISVYANEYSHKADIGAYIDAWKNQGTGHTAVGYFDVSEMFLANLNTIINLVSLLLIAVASISLVVSTVMIGVITANSVVERTREIGILRSLGARKADIRNVFVAETTIIGLWSGLLGILITYVLCPIISAIIGAVSGVGGLLMLNPLHALLLVALSLVLTVLSGVLPAIGASRKNVVEALRVE